MEIGKYADYFHDGSLMAIKQQDKEIQIKLESAVILDVWEIDKELLSPSKTIMGWLVLEDVSEININNDRSQYFEMKAEDGEILDLRIKPNEVFILIEWNDYTIKPVKKELDKIEIKAKKIKWVSD